MATALTEICKGCGALIGKGDAAHLHGQDVYCDRCHGGSKGNDAPVLSMAARTAKSAIPPIDPAAAEQFFRREAKDRAGGFSVVEATVFCLSIFSGIVSFVIAFAFSAENEGQHAARFLSDNAVGATANAIERMSEAHQPSIVVGIGVLFFILAGLAAINANLRNLCRRL